MAVYDALVNDVTKEDFIGYVSGIVDEFKNVSGLNITDVFPHDPEGQFMLHFILHFVVCSNNLISIIHMCYVWPWPACCRCDLHVAGLAQFMTKVSLAFLNHAAIIFCACDEQLNC